jgi:hypothetical protein
MPTYADLNFPAISKLDHRHIRGLVVDGLAGDEKLAPFKVANVCVDIPTLSVVRLLYGGVAGKHNMHCAKHKKIKLDIG